MPQGQGADSKNLVRHEGQHIESPGAEIVFDQQHGHSIDEKSGRDIFKTAARRTKQTRSEENERKTLE